MRRISILYHVTALFVFVQLVIGGLLTFDYVGFESHMGFGFVVGVLALVSLAVALVAKPRYAPLRLSTIVLFVLIVVQGLLGFAISSNSTLVIAHYVNALVIFGVSLAMTFYAARWSKLPLSAGTTAED